MICLFCRRNDHFSNDEEVLKGFAHHHQPFQTGRSLQSVGQSSYAQTVSTDFRYQQTQCIQGEKGRCDVWKCKGSNDKGPTGDFSNISHSFLYSSEILSAKNTGCKREGTVQGRVNTEQIQNETDRRGLIDVTNRNQQQNIVSNHTTNWDVKGKENGGRKVSASSQKIKNDGSLADVMHPLSVRRLRPIRQKTRNVVLSILEDETVCLEFIKPKGKDLLVTDVLRISSDGNKITSYNTGREGVPVQEHPPEIPGTAVSYAFSGLPQKLWKKYQYADKFIRLVRMKSPKVRYIHMLRY